MVVITVIEKSLVVWYIYAIISAQLSIISCVLIYFKLSGVLSSYLLLWEIFISVKVRSVNCLLDFNVVRNYLRLNVGRIAFCLSYNYLSPIIYK